MRMIAVMGVLALALSGCMPGQGGEGPAPAAGASGVEWRRAPAEGLALVDAAGAPVGAVEGGVILAAGETRAAPGGPLRLVWLGERAGWAPAAALAPLDLPLLPGTELPATGICAGFEPHWALRWSAGEMRFSVPGGESRAAMTAPLKAEGAPHVMLRAADGDAAWLLRITPELCPFSPLDRPPLWSGSLLIETPEGPVWRLGCCRPLPPEG